MAFEVLINTITVVCLVLFGLWIVAHVAQAAGLLLVRRAYRRHSKHVFTIPFVPLHTRLFHELAVPQLLASEAIQLGDLPPAPPGSRADAAEYVHPGVAPSAPAPAFSMRLSSPTDTVLTSASFSTTPNSADSKLKKSNKKQCSKAKEEKKKFGGAFEGRINADEPVAVPVGQPSAVLTSAAAAGSSGLSWWSPTMEGKDLVLGLQLPLQLRSTATRPLAVKLEKQLRGAVSSFTAKSNTFGQLSSEQHEGSNRINGGKSGGNGNSAVASLNPLNSQRHEPSVSLQLKSYRLTSAALLSRTAPFISNAYVPSSNLQNATLLDVELGSKFYRAHHHIGESWSDLSGESSKVQAAIAAQLARSPVPINTRWMVETSVPRRIGPSYPLQTIMSNKGLNSGGDRADGLDFDAMKFTYIRHQQRLLEVAVAEQTAMVYQGQNDRKSAKRAQRIAAVLMRYLQYTHEDDEDATIIDDSIVDENSGSADSSPDTSALHNSCSLERGSRSVPSRNLRMVGSRAGSSVLASSCLTQRRSSRSPWVPLLGDGRVEQGGGRLNEPFSTPSTSGASSPPKRHSHSFSQPSASTPQAPSAHKKRGKDHHTRNHEASASAAASSSGAAVVTTPPLTHNTRRSTRKRRGAAPDMTDSAVATLESLVERVRQAQTLRPRYQALLCTVSFRAERFIVRRGADGPPLWIALPTAHSTAGTVTSSAPTWAFGPTSPLHGVEGVGVRESRLMNAVTLTGNNGNDMRASNWRPRRGSSDRRHSGSGVYEFTLSDSATGISNSGEFAPESSFTSAADGRSDNRGTGSRGLTSPPSPEGSTSMPLSRGQTAEFIDETAVADEEFASALSTSISSRKSDIDVPSVLKTPSMLQMLSRQSPILSTDLEKPLPMNTTGIPGGAAYTTSLGSTSANDAAMEFLCASRRLKLDYNTPQASFDFFRNSSLNRPAKKSSILRESGGYSSGGTPPLPMERGRQRCSAGQQSALSTCALRDHFGMAKSLQQDTSSVYSDGEALCAPSQPQSPEQGESTIEVSQWETQPQPSLLAEGQKVAGITEAQPTVPAMEPCGPRAGDLRMVYIIGADRATLLRSLTLHATETFAAGAQNFLCFFTQKDEQQARRRYLEEIDRQNRLELQQRARVLAALQRSDSQSGPITDAAAADEVERADGSRSNRDDDTKALQPYRVKVSRPAVPSRTTSRLNQSSLRHSRTRSWHAFGTGGSSDFDSNSADFRDNGGAIPPGNGGITTAETQGSHHGRLCSLHSRHSFAGDSPTVAPLRQPQSASHKGDGAVLTVQANVKFNRALDESLLNVSDTLSPHSLEASLHPRDNGSSAGPQQGSSGYGCGAAATDIVETHGFETVFSAPSSMLSTNGSMTSVPSQKEDTTASADVLLPDEPDNTDTEGTIVDHQLSGINRQKSSARGEREHKHTQNAEGSQLHSIVSTDNAFKHSLHSLDSFVDSGLAEHLTDASHLDTPPLPQLKVEVSTGIPLTEENNKLTPVVAGFETTGSNSEGVTETNTKDEVEGSKPTTGGIETMNEAKKSRKRLNMLTIATSETKATAKNTQRAAAAVSAATTIKTATVPSSSTLSSSTTPILPPTATTDSTLPALELRDTIGDHDVRRYHAAIGVTLPEQVFLLRDTAAKSEVLLSASFSDTYGVGGNGSDAEARRHHSAAPTQRASITPMCSRSSSLVALQNPAMPRRALKARGAARVLEGQVEVAELSLNVLSRLLEPFFPQKEPSLSIRSHSSADEHFSHGSECDIGHHSPTTSEDDSSEDSCEEWSSLLNSTSLSDSDDYSYSRLSKKRQQGASENKKPKAAQGAKKERDARHSSKNEQNSGKKRIDDRASSKHRSSKKRTQGRRGNRGKTNAAAAAAAASRTKRYRQHRQRQQRLIAVWRRRIHRKQAATSKVGYSPISVAVLFFTAPPKLPLPLLQRLEALQSSYEDSPVPLPAWAIGDNDAGTPLGAAPSRRMVDGPSVEPSQQQQLQQQVHQQPHQQMLARICVTLIYTSTTEHVAQTLLLASRMAASERLAKKDALMTSFEQSIVPQSSNNHENNNNRSYSGGHHRNNWVDELPDWRQSGRGLSSSTGRFIGNGYVDDVCFPKGSSLMNTNPPSPNDCIYTRGRARGTHSLSSSLTTPPSPRVESGTAMFASDETSFSSDMLAAAARTQTQKGSQSDKLNSGSSFQGVGKGGALNSTAAATAGESTTERRSPPLSPLLLLTESTDSICNNGGDDSFSAPWYAQSNMTEGIGRTSTSVFNDNDVNFDAHRTVKEDTICFNDDVLSTAGGRNMSYGGPEGNVNVQAGDRGSGDDYDHKGEGERSLTTAADSVVNVLRDVSSFPDGVPVNVALTYIRIGNDLYSVTEVVDRTFLQYREERVIQPNAADDVVKGRDDNDAASVVFSSTSSTFSDNGEDAEARNSASNLFNASIPSNTPFSKLNAALEAIQNQHEATARQQQRRMHHRRRAVSTMHFGELSYSLAGSAPVRPGTRRQEVHMCWRCLSAEAAVIFLPCGHYAVCEGCAEVLADCCVCKTPILSSVVLLEREKTKHAFSTPKRQQHQKQSSRRRRSVHEPRPAQ